MHLRGGVFGRVIAILVILGHLGACATRPENIHPRYLSPLLFDKATCGQLRTESSTLTAQLGPLGKRINRNATVDAIWVSVYIPLVVLLPFTFFLLSGNGAEYEEYSGLLGQRDAVRQQLDSKHCEP